MPGPSLSVEIKEAPGASVVCLLGDIDASSVREFQSKVKALCERPACQVILDCSSLNYVNSTGLGVLFTLSQTCRDRGGQLTLCGVRPKIQNVIKVLGLHGLLAMRENCADVIPGAKETIGTGL